MVEMHRTAYILREGRLWPLDNHYEIIDVQWGVEQRRLIFTFAQGTSQAVTALIGALNVSTITNIWNVVKNIVINNRGTVETPDYRVVVDDVNVESIGGTTITNLSQIKADVPTEDITRIKNEIVDDSIDGNETLLKRVKDIENDALDSSDIPSSVGLTEDALDKVAEAVRDDSNYDDHDTEDISLKDVVKSISDDLDVVRRSLTHQTVNNARTVLWYIAQVRTKTNQLRFGSIAPIGEPDAGTALLKVDASELTVSGDSVSVDLTPLVNQVKELREQMLEATFDDDGDDSTDEVRTVMGKINLLVEVLQNVKVINVAEEGKDPDWRVKVDVDEVDLSEVTDVLDDKLDVKVSSRATKKDVAIGGGGEFFGEVNANVVKVDGKKVTLKDLQAKKTDVPTVKEIRDEVEGGVLGKVAKKVEKIKIKDGDVVATLDGEEVKMKDMERLEIKDYAKSEDVKKIKSEIVENSEGIVKRVGDKVDMVSGKVDMINERVGVISTVEQLLEEIQRRIENSEKTVSEVVRDEIGKVDWQAILDEIVMIRQRVHQGDEISIADAFIEQDGEWMVFRNNKSNEEIVRLKKNDGVRGPVLELGD